PGAVLPSGLKIQSAKIRGVKSEGMICSEIELGLSDVADEIMALPQSSKPGQMFEPENLRDDKVLNVFINPNRPDCMSVIGLAREIAALSGKRLHDKPIDLPNRKGLPVTDFKIEILDSKRCPRYCGAVISGIKVKPSPYSIQQRLFAVGIRPINNIVDATNYCLVEWGHPLHAFDLKHLKGNRIIVKTAKENQNFTTLDGVSRTLNEDMLMICDGERPVAIGGIMGGLNSEIKDSTKDIFLESAYFLPENNLKSAKKLELATEASRRFERGMDPNFCLEALKRLTHLILKLSPGQLRHPFLDVYPKKVKVKSLKIRLNRLNEVLGTNYAPKRIVNTISKLGLKTTSSDSEFATFEIPTFRHDLNREIDLIEEFARIDGLDNIDSQEIARVKLRNVCNEQVSSIQKIRSIFVEFGFMEAYNYSMIDITLKDAFKDRGKPIILKNPISPELSMMRPSLLPGLLQVAQYNINREAGNLRVFELGRVFAKNFMKKRGKNEGDYLAGVLLGNRIAPYWNNHEKIPVDIFAIKGILESFFRKISLDILQIICYDSSYMEQACSILVNDKKIGLFGRYRNGSLNAIFDEPIFLFEIDIQPILNHLIKERHFQPFSKYPPAKRELAFVIPDSRPVQDVINEIKNVGGELLHSITVEDVYKGKPVPDDSRSVRVSLKFYAQDRSLQVDEIEDIIDNIIKASLKKFKINIRL
ncbi:phenylalanine--tRNA ligase subunit beta, partial [candidate division KSB1 bacterium]|nr:phenylalanine--tRNA ligase subunit beta [candidate division KSB1 bacterium]